MRGANATLVRLVCLGRAALERPTDPGGEPVYLDGLHEEVAGTLADGGHGSLDGGMAGEHDDLRAGAAPLDFLEQLHAIHAWHLEIDDCDVDGLATDDLKSARPCGWCGRCPVE